jgi:hypothetical protein
MRRPLTGFAAVFLLSLLAFRVYGADGVEVALASTRSHFSTDEPVELALLYKNDGGNAKTLPLEVRHDDGSQLTFPIPFDVAAGKAQTRLVTLHPRALKIGNYTVVCRLGAGENSAKFSVHPAEHTSAYWVGQWVHQGESRETTLAKGGWMYFTSDLATLHPRKPARGDLAEAYVEASMKPFPRMVLGGGHQLDLDLVNDWGDPWVQRTIAWRMQLAALSNRIYPLAGLHCYDEPGLTWWPTKDVDGHKADINPFSIPHQHDEFTRLTGKKLPQGPFSFTGPQYAQHLDDWLDFMDLRMKYLEQAWHATVWGTQSVEPRLQTINQVSSSYAAGTATDGVDSRQARPYAIVSGHGGYSDLPFGTMQPVRSAEAFRGFSWERPHYFLPMWYTHTWATMRNAVWMAWTTKLEGMMVTPEQDFGLNNEKFGYHGTNTVFEIAEINRRLALVGDIMRQLPKTPASVAVLQSHRQVAHDIATLNSPQLHKIGSPQYASPHRAAVDACFFRVMEQGMTPNWIDEAEAAEKGTDFLKQWKVIMCPRLATAAPAFRKALEGYVAAGGKLIQFKGDKLLIPGSIVADHGFGDPSAYYFDKVEKDGGITSPAYRDLSWRQWSNDLAPTFGKDLAGWIGPQPYECGNKEILLGVHKAGKATYLLFANNRTNPRGVKHELIPAEATVKVPEIAGGGILLDLLNGGEIPVENGAAKLRLGAGDGACWVHLPNFGAWTVGVSTYKATETRPREPKMNVELEIHVNVEWKAAGFLPFRVRLLDPDGNVVEELIRATPPAGPNGEWDHAFPLGPLAKAGKWNVKLDWLFINKSEEHPCDVPATEPGPLASLATENVSVYFDDAQRITNLFAGKAFEPPFDKLNWDAKRVFGLDSKKFAVFGPEATAEKVAAALRGKGMTVQVNPKYEVKPFQREPDRGGAGVSHGVNSNLENILAHTIVLPGHPLLTQSLNRGHINREANATFPGPGRVYIQWGIGCYQAGWQNIFVQGDTDAGVAWLFDAINGKMPEAKNVELTPEIRRTTSKKTELPGKFTVKQEIKTYDTPVGVGSSPDGKVTYVALYDGSVAAHDATGKELWHINALLEGCALAVNPKGDRLAVAGYPGLLVLDTADGKVLGGHRAAPVDKGHTPAANRMLAAAWNDAGTLVAAGWLNPDAKTPLDPVILDSQGKETARPKGIGGGVMGVVFVPGSDVALFGADQLTAVKATDGTVLWRNGIKGAQGFAFGGNGKTAAAGGWGKSAGTFNLSDGKQEQTATFDSVVGGVAMLPNDGLAVAVWGGTHPLFVLRPGSTKAEPFFPSRFGFQNVAWSAVHKRLIAAEQGGNVWLLDDQGKPQALLDDAGTTAYRLQLRDGEVLLGRMNRSVQRLALNE